MKYFSQIAFPITLNKCLSSFLRTFENILIPNQLAVFYASREEALSSFGALKGMALPLLFFPASFLSAFSTLMVPETSEAKKRNQKNRLLYLVQKTFSITLTAGVLIALLFGTFAEEIAKLLYPQSEVAIYLKGLSLLIPFMYLESAVNGVMQGLNQQRKVLLYNAIDSCIRIGLIYCALPKYGMVGFLVIMYVSNIITSCFNAHRVLKVSGSAFAFSDWVLKPVLSAMASFVLCQMMPFPFQNPWWLLGSKIFVISGVYACFMMLFGLWNVKNIKLQKRSVGN